MGYSLGVMKTLKINPEVHKLAKQTAASMGQFLQDFIEQAIRTACGKPQPEPKPRVNKKAG